MKLRPAAADDAAETARIHVETWRAAYPGLLPEQEIRSISIEQRLGFWKGVLAKPNGWRIDLAVDDANVVGFCSYGSARDIGDASAEIYALYVHPDRWRRGAGRLLCERAVAAAAEREHRAITLWVVKGNDRACRFYERLGCVADGEERRNTRFLKTPFDEIRYRTRSRGRSPN